MMAVILCLLLHLASPLILCRLITSDEIYQAVIHYLGIRDTDMAEEMMAYTKNNILVQAAQAMLAQANTVPQGVLQLLQ